jgi:putative ABC transport system permease protein
MEVAADKEVPPEQIKAWKKDRTGCLVDQSLAEKYGWKIGDRITLQGNIFPTNLELTIRALYKIDPPNNSLYFNAKYLEESVGWFKDTAGFYFMRSTTCFITFPSPPRARAKKPSNSISLPALGM